MNASLRAAELFNFELPQRFETADYNRARAGCSFLDFALDTCIEIAKRSSTSEPHFVWEDMGRVNISPSEYQFCTIDWSDEELVSVGDEELAWREYCLKAVDALERYSLLEAGWDGDEAIAPSAASLADAHVFLRLISSEIESCPVITPVIDDEGIPSFIFDNKATYISISFYGENSVTAYEMHRASRKSSVSTFNLDENEKLKAILRSIHAL